MLLHPVVDKLKQLRLLEMANQIKNQINLPEINNLNFEERLALLVDMEITARDNRRLQMRLRKAQLKNSASMEDIDYQTPRGLDKSLLLKLSDCAWVNTQNILIVGSTGTGKTFLACALSHKACLSNHSAAYYRMPRLLSELQLAKGIRRQFTLPVGDNSDCRLNGIKYLGNYFSKGGRNARDLDNKSTGGIIYAIKKRRFDTNSVSSKSRN